MSFYSAAEEVQDLNARMEVVLRGLSALTIRHYQVTFDEIWADQEGKVFAKIYGWRRLECFPDGRLPYDKWEIENKFFEEELEEIKGDINAVIPQGMIENLRIRGVNLAEVIFDFGHVRGFVA